MRKTLLLLLVLFVALWFAERPAQAVHLIPGAFQAHLRDASALYVDTDDDALTPRAPLDVDPVAGGGAPAPWADTAAQVGDELRIVFNVDEFIYQGGLHETLPAGELTGLIYDLKLVEITITGTQVDLYFGALGRNALSAPIAGEGGVVEVWLDPTPENGPTSGLSSETDIEALFDPNGTPGVAGGDAPFLWDEASGPGGRDGYPTVNDLSGSGGPADDSILYLQAVLTPIGLTPAGGLPFLLQEQLDLALLTRSGSMPIASFLDVVGGVAGPHFATDLFGLGRDISLQSTMLLPGNPFYDGFAPDEGNWAVSSSDPVRGRINAIPEPATMTLLGLSLAGLGAFFRRRRK